MFTNTFSKLVLFCIITIFSFSCTIPLKAIKTGPENPASVPQDFDPKENVLLVVAIPQLDNEALIDMKNTIKLEEQMQKQYPYSYKVVTQKELKEAPGQYGDTSRYRFALLSERRVIRQAGSFQLDVEDGLAFVPGYKATYIDLVFYDRITGQRYPPSGTSTSEMKLAVNNLTLMINKVTKQKEREKLKGATAQHESNKRTELLFSK